MQLYRRYRGTVYKKIVVEVQKGELLVEVKTNIRDNEKEWRK